MKQARNLPLFERSGVQSSVFTIEFQGWQSRSKVFDNSLNPNYNELFQFPLGKAGILQDELITIIAQTYKTEGQGRTLGQCSRTIPVEDLKNKKTVLVVWPLNDIAGKPNGAEFELALKANFQPCSERIEKERLAKPIDTSLLPQEPDTYKLRFLIHKCTKLAQNPCSAIAVVRFGTKIKSTQICELTQNPEFEEEINFVIHMSQKDIAKEMVIIEVLNTLRTDNAAVVGEYKFMLETAFASEPIGWDEPAYEANTVCRTMIRKWIILTNPFQTPKNINGFTNLSFSVLQSGQALTRSPTIEPIILNVVRNVMRPSEVSAQYKQIIFRIYDGHEFPPMDDREDEIATKLKLSRTAFCDPFLSISYCGVVANTPIKYATYNPQFYTDIIFNIEIPAVTDVVVLTLYDYDTDEVGSDTEPIATRHLSLTEISYMEDDENGFDPTFGPALMPFYGAPKHCGMGAYKELNEKDGGIGYRGRLLMEVFTLPSYSVGIFAKTRPVPDIARKRAMKIMRTQKLVLLMGCTEATMIPEEYADSTIKFEISSGDFGYSDSLFTPPSNNDTSPQVPLFDSVKYYFVDFPVDQACIVPMEWECTLFRLEHLNILEKIKEYFIKSLEELDDDIQKEKLPAEIKLSMKTLMRKTIDKCGVVLPDLPSNANELDRNQKKVREMKLQLIISQCKSISREGKLDGTRTALEWLKTILQILEEVCKEPQIEMPNAIVYMYAGTKPVAYFSSPLNYFLDSTVARGKDCERLMYVNFKPLDGRDITAAQLLCFFWFGTEQNYKDNFQFPFDGRVTSYAEMVSLFINISHLCCFTGMVSLLINISHLPIYQYLTSVLLC